MTDGFYSKPNKNEYLYNSKYQSTKTANGFYSKWRLRSFAIIIGLIVFLTMAKFAKIMFQPQGQSTVQKEIRERGSILDRNGKVLAIQTKVYNLGVDPKKVQEENFYTLAQILSPIIGINATEIEEKLKATTNSFTYLKKKITPSEADDVLAAVEAANIRGETLIRRDHAAVQCGGGRENLEGGARLIDVGKGRDPHQFRKPCHIVSGGIIGIVIRLHADGQNRPRIHIHHDALHGRGIVDRDAFPHGFFHNALNGGVHGQPQSISRFRRHIGGFPVRQETRPHVRFRAQGAFHAP